MQTLSNTGPQTHSRRFGQFSLRTLLVVATFVPPIGAWVGVEVSKLLEQRRAANAANARVQAALNWLARQLSSGSGWSNLPRSAGHGTGVENSVPAALVRLGALSESNGQSTDNVVNVEANSRQCQETRSDGSATQ